MVKCTLIKTCIPCVKAGCKWFWGRFGSICFKHPWEKADIFYPHQVFPGDICPTPASPTSTPAPSSSSTAAANATSTTEAMVFGASSSTLWWILGSVLFLIFAGIIICVAWIWKRSDGEDETPIEPEVVYTALPQESPKKSR